jgi:hypothetical protein
VRKSSHSRWLCKQGVAGSIPVRSIDLTEAPPLFASRWGFGFAWRGMVAVTLAVTDLPGEGEALMFGVITAGLPSVYRRRMLAPPTGKQNTVSALP